MSASRITAVVLLLAGAVAPLAAAQESPSGTPQFAACRDAADFLLNGVGVALEDLDPAIAVPVCTAALGESPDDPWLMAWLARALRKAERVEESVAMAQQSATAGPVGQLVLGTLLRRPCRRWTVEVSEALRLARARYPEEAAPSLLAYVYYGDVSLTMSLP